jgi:hypothetical protein
VIEELSAPPVHDTVAVTRLDGVPVSAKLFGLGVLNVYRVVLIGVVNVNVDAVATPTRLAGAKFAVYVVVSSKPVITMLLVPAAIKGISTLGIGVIVNL